MNPFKLDLQDATEHDVAMATFYGLVTSGWTVYTMWLRAHAATKKDADALETDAKVKHAKAAFEYVAAQLPAGPFRRELERYRDEAVPTRINNDPA